MPSLVSQTEFLEWYNDLWNNAVATGDTISLAVIEIDQPEQYKDINKMLERVGRATESKLRRTHDLITPFSPTSLILIMERMSFSRLAHYISTIHDEITLLKYDDSNDVQQPLKVSIGYTLCTPIHSKYKGELGLLSQALSYVALAKNEGGNCSRTKVHEEDWMEFESDIFLNTRKRYTDKEDRKSIGVWDQPERRG